MALLSLDSVQYVHQSLSNCLFLYFLIHLAFSQLSRHASLHPNTTNFTERGIVHENPVVHSLLHSHFTLCDQERETYRCNMKPRFSLIHIFLDCTRLVKLWSHVRPITALCYIALNHGKPIRTVIF